MPKVFTSKTQKTGEIGENIAVRFLVKRSFSIIERNYTKKWGEIDIVAEKEGKLYFIEVKSVSTVSFEILYNRKTTYCGATNHYRPEENMHPRKIERMKRAIQTYLISRRKYQNMEWQVNLLVVYLDLNNKKAKVKVISNIVL